ncbi:MAG: 3-oxoacyl-ACP synthase [Bacillota bacterium]
MENHVSIGVQSIGVYIPDTFVESGEIAELSGIPEQVVREKFGIFKKPKAGKDLHVSDMAVAAAERAMKGVPPSEIDALIYFGSEYKDYNVWPVGAHIQQRLGIKKAFAFEVMALCASGALVLKLAKEMLMGDPDLNNILVVMGSKESELLNYSDHRMRFLFNFSDGAAAAVIKKDCRKNRILSSALITDGDFSLDVYLGEGGSKLRGKGGDIGFQDRFFEVPDPENMKKRLDKVSLSNFRRVIGQAAVRSGFTVDDIRFIGITHMKKSFYEAILKEFNLSMENTFYLENYGHVQAGDQLIILEEATRLGSIGKGELVVVAGAGTGYTWGATALLWGEPGRA